MKLEVAGISHTGAVRESNQDVVAWQVTDDGGSALLVVADGMGGYQGGEIASRLAADSVMEVMVPVLFMDEADKGEIDPNDCLETAFDLANDRILERRKTDERLEKMGTTLVVAWVEGNTAHITHAGDSRCYLIRDGQPTCLTRDDTVVQNMLEDGSINEADVANVPFRNVLTRAVGAMNPLELTFCSQPVRTGDCLLLCSDGLTHSVPEAEWNRILKESESRESAVNALIEAALERQASDNVSVVLLTLK
ncbi:protein phosphatase 2C domain-containing protein [Marinobacter sp. chi1]|uniref:Protein phosphatase 2C domain-containing protein n=1 Tax=Marinobacter suaedae TaxID=3057675 RepID=A0ABT8W3N3_9GAMM|nr:protein phosphatase 2C domain-containing protein [Marinobacter sp. chi1]MDO3722855.1 protein phosphatase 2C domain-containing protein [Marinobacter sp. chi1]